MGRPSKNAATPVEPRWARARDGTTNNVIDNSPTIKAPRETTYHQNKERLSSSPLRVSRTRRALWLRGFELSFARSLLFLPFAFAHPLLPLVTLDPVGKNIGATRASIYQP